MKYTSYTFVFLSYFLTFSKSGGESCIYDPGAEFYTHNGRSITRGRQVIVPSLTFNCYGRINHIVSTLINPAQSGDDLPVFQIWRPSLLGSNFYNKIGQIHIPVGNLIPKTTFYYVDTRPQNHIEFQPGDVIGYYQPSSPHRLLWSLEETGYVSYSNNASDATATINTSNVDYTDNNLLPFFRVYFDTLQCKNLSNLANGRINCSLGDDKVVSNGDSCIFTCNNGYELTGSHIRTCQSNGSWNGIETSCKKVSCLKMDDVSNGVISCPSRDNQYHSYEDICNFTCNTGFKLTGSDSRSCQSNGSWSGIQTKCERVLCPLPSDLENGVLRCPARDNGILLYNDRCSFTCHADYVLNGSSTRTCQSNGTWNGTEAICIKVLCPLPSDPENGVRKCPTRDNGNLLYNDRCSFTCHAGYVLNGSSTRTCQSNGTWNGTEAICIKVLCPLPSDPENGVRKCPTRDNGNLLYNDRCSFTCHAGYVLNGSSTRTCQSNGTWNGTEAICIKVLCPLPSDPENGVRKCPTRDNGILLYNDRCSFTCHAGYVLNGSSTRTCQSNGTWNGTEAICVKGVTEIRNDESEPENNDEDNGSGPSGAAIGGAIGALLFIIAIIMIVLFVILYRRRNKKAPPEGFNAVHNPLYGHYVTTRSSRSDYDEPYVPDYSVMSSTAKAIEYDLPTSSVDKVASASPPKMNQSEKAQNVYTEPYNDKGIYNNVYTEPCNDKGIYNNVYTEPCNDKGIYNNVCTALYNDKGNYGPLYCEPSSDEQKIYEEFEEKRFCKLHHNEIRTFEELGTGEFGVVTHGKWKQSTDKELEVAVKTLNVNASAKDRLRFLQEAAIMCQFDHPNVIKLYGVVTETPIMIVLEFMPHGNLRNFLMQLRHTSTVARERIALTLVKFCNEIAAGMLYLSGKQFVHRDLAARNILISENFTCKIADFGMSRDLIDHNYYIMSGGKIPVKWTAPEAIHYRKYSVQSDVWSYGCVLYEIWSLGYKPFEELTNTEALEKVDRGYRLPPPPGCPRAVYTLMINCWHPDANSRPRFGQIAEVLAGNTESLLGWSDEDKQIGGEDAMKLGASLKNGSNLYFDLQLRYKQ